jgi:hypothetical protein
MSKLGGIRQRGVNVFRPQGRIAPENLILRGALCKAVEHYCDRNASTGDANVPSANLRVARKMVLPIGHIHMITVERESNLLIKRNSRIRRKLPVVLEIDLILGARRTPPLTRQNFAVSR